MSQPVVQKAMDVSRHRMHLSSPSLPSLDLPLDLVAFHWWEYEDTRYMDMLQNAQLLSRLTPPVLQAVSLTNFDTIRLKEIIEVGGVNIISNQISMSVLDTRAID